SSCARAACTRRCANWVNKITSAWESSSGPLPASDAAVPQILASAQGEAAEAQGVCPMIGQRAGGGSGSSRILLEGAHTWRKTIWASSRIIMPSFLSPPGRLRLSCMISHKPNKLYQGLRSEKDWARLLKHVGGGW